MIEGISRIAVLSAVLLATTVSLAEEQVLYWMVDASATMEFGSGATSDLNEFITVAPDDSDQWYAARIRVIGDGITEDTFLNLYDLKTGSSESGELGIAFDNNAGYWGAGVPTGNQSPAPADPYASSDPVYSFIVEIGNVMWNESSQTASWVETVAASTPASYTSLGSYIGESSDISPLIVTPWTPTSFHEVPEPSSGLLLLIGGALLTLRRRRNGGI